MFLRPLGVLFGLLEALLGASGSLLERSSIVLGAKLGGLGATFGALRFLIFFWSDVGGKKGAQREAFWEPKRSKNQSKNEVQI